MEHSDRIAEEFNRLIEERPKTYAEQVVFFVVVARCEIDMAGFLSVFEQALDHEEVLTLIAGLRKLDAQGLAEEFSTALALLETADFYPDRDSRKLSSSARDQVADIKGRIGDRMWDLDAKLVELLNLAAGNGKGA
jgi:hypothetical protein